MNVKLTVLMLLIALLTGMLIAAETGWPPNASDLSEKIFRDGDFIRFDSRGFGIHDIGDDFFKIYDWKFNLLKKIPIKKGEGPSEIRKNIAAAAWTKDGYLFLNGDNEYKINKYDPSGKYVTTYKMEFLPFSILENNGKLYVFNQNMEMAKNDAPFMHIIDGLSGKILKKVSFQTIPNPKDKLSEGNSSHYNVLLNKNGSINIVCGLSPSLYQVTDEGKILKKTILPFIDLLKEKQGKNYWVVQWFHMYYGATMIKDVIYTLFVEFDYKDTSKSLNRLIKIEPNGKVSVIKELIGYYKLIGSDSNQVFLFERNEYFVLPIDISKPNK